VGSPINEKNQMNYLENPLFLLAITFGIYFFSKYIQLKTGWVLLNPILLTIAALIIFLKLCNISYETYHLGGQFIEFWLKPAVVALGVPLYLQLEKIKKQLWPILFSQLAGCIVGVISVVLIAKLLGGSKEVILSLAAKSVTTPIAMEVTKTIGGIPSLTAAVVVCVGLFGAIFGFQILALLKIESPIAQGLSMGTAAHAVGTSTAMDVSGKYGAYASLGLTLNGIFTALFTPTILRLLDLL
jgi:predicted murein hydrolase (TIGR00659 family)